MASLKFSKNALTIRELGQLNMEMASERELGWETSERGQGKREGMESWHWHEAATIFSSCFYD